MQEGVRPSEAILEMRVFLPSLMSVQGSVFTLGLSVVACGPGARQ